MILLSKRCTDLVIYRWSYPYPYVAAKLPYWIEVAEDRNTYSTYSKAEGIFLEKFRAENQRLSLRELTRAVVNDEINTSTFDVLITFSFS